MKELRLCVVLLALQCTLHFAKAVQIGFGETDYDVLEGEGEVRLLATKLDATTENVTVRVLLVTLEEFEALDREFETQVEINNPAEYSLNQTGRRDFVRSGPIEITFLPSQDSQDQTFIVPIVTDDINEADEVFFAVIEPVDILDPTREVTLLEGGVTRINIRDDDAIAFGYEKREYTFPEEDLVVDDTVLVISNGVESEQVLEVFSLASSAGFSQEGEDFVIDDRIALTFNPGNDRLPVPFRILADDVSEGLESFNMVLSISDDVPGLRLDLSNAGTTVFIDDDDNTTIGFETTTLVVREDEGSVEVCVRAIAPDEFTVRVIATVVTEDGEAVEGEDFQFGSRNIALSQEASSRRRCVRIPIIDDDESEPDETFQVILERNPRLTSSNIEFNTTSITVVIADDDRNPCLDGTSTCDANADCENNEGSFTCTCRERFTGDGFTCQSIDECTLSDQCHSQAECIIQDSGNKCECNSGFQGDGIACDDINECLTNQDDCVPNADCINTEGSFMCQCRDGFEGADCSPVPTQAVEPTTQVIAAVTSATTAATTPTIATTTQAMTTRKPFPIPSIWRPGLPIRPRPPRPRPRPRPRPNPMPRPTVSVPEPEPLPPCSNLGMDVDDDDDEDTSVSRSTSRRRSTRRRSRRWGRYLYRWKAAKSKSSKSRTTETQSSVSMCNPAESSRSTSRRSTTSYTRSSTNSSSKSTKYTKSSSKSRSKSTKSTKSSSTSYSKSTKRG